ncbi:hypothetical protein DFH06DRAFT_46722 [Mycena polygramma]|nr:hypothetical protein DFH06DRAFT_46722 [Mycena polygramma]
MTSSSPQDYAQAAPDQTWSSFDVPTFTPSAIPRVTHAVDPQSFFHDYSNDASYPEQPPPHFFQPLDPEIVFTDIPDYVNGGSHQQQPPPHSFQPLDPEIVFTDIPDYVNGGSYQQQPLPHSFHPLDPELVFTDIPDYANGASYPQQPPPHSFPSIEPELAFTDINIDIGATIDPFLLQTPYATDFHSSGAFASEQQPPPLLPNYPPQDVPYNAPHTLPSTNVNPWLDNTAFAPQLPANLPPYPETYPTSMEFPQGYDQSLGYPELQDYHQLQEIPEQPATGAGSSWSAALVPPGSAGPSELPNYYQSQEDIQQPENGASSSQSSVLPALVESAGKKRKAAQAAKPPPMPQSGKRRRFATDNPKANSQMVKFPLEARKRASRKTPAQRARSSSQKTPKIPRQASSTLPPAAAQHASQVVSSSQSVQAAGIQPEANCPPLVPLEGLVYGENNLPLPRLPQGSRVAFEVYRGHDLAERRQREGENFYGNELLRSSGERFVVRIFGWQEPAPSHHTEQNLEDPQSQVVAGVQNPLPSPVSVPEWSVPTHDFSSAPYPPATEEDLTRMINEAQLIAADTAADLTEPWADYFPSSF